MPINETNFSDSDLSKKHLNGLKILLIEDFDADAEIIARTLKKQIGSFNFKHLKNHSELAKHFSQFKPDIILSDYSLPGITGLQILKNCKLINPDIPFIIVTGAVDEETAVDCIKAGASDYVLKDNLIRLGPALSNALEKSFSMVEKRKALQTLQENEKHLSLILSTSPVGIINVNSAGIIIFANKQAESIFSSSANSIVSKKFYDPEWEITDFENNPIPPENIPFFMVKKTLKPVTDIWHVIKKQDGIAMYLSINANPVFDSDQIFSGMMVSVQDITPKIKAEKEVVLSEAKYRELFENMIEGFAYHKIITNEKNEPIDYEFIDINPAFEKFTGLKRSEILNKTVKEIMPETEDIWITEYGKVALTGKSVSFTNYSKVIDKYFEVTAFSPQEGYFVVAFNDVTQRKQYENELSNYQQKLKALNAELTLIEEKEKRRLAINLHDHFSQLLAISKMRLSELINSKNFSKEKGQLSEVRDYIEKALSNSRKLTYELSPPILYELGLIRALKWCIEKESENHGFDFSFNCKFKSIDYSENGQIILYRVFCELITNIIKHAKATNINVIVERANDILNLSVADNGKGFNVKKNLAQSSSFGLFSIRERIEYLNGNFNIESASGIGTTVRITIPLTNHE